MHYFQKYWWSKILQSYWTRSFWPITCEFSRYGVCRWQWRIEMSINSENSILDPIVSSPLKYGGTLFLKRHILVEGVEKMFILRKTTLIGEFRVIFFYYRRGRGEFRGRIFDASGFWLKITKKRFAPKLKKNIGNTKFSYSKRKNYDSFRKEKIICSKK